MRDEPDYNYEKEMILVEMDDYAMHAERAIAKFVHPSLLKEFLQIFVYSYFEDHTNAIRIANDLELSPIHLMALEGDYKGFRDLYLNEMDHRNGEAMYDSMH